MIDISIVPWVGAARIVARSTVVRDAEKPRNSAIFLARPRVINVRFLRGRPRLLRIAFGRTASFHTENRHKPRLRMHLFNSATKIAYGGCVGALAGLAQAYALNLIVT